MRIAYCTTVRLPSERARGYQVAKVVEALHELGYSAEIFCPYAESPHGRTFESYYSLNFPVRLHQLGRSDFIHSFKMPGTVTHKLSTFFFKKSLKRALALHRSAYDLYYTRSIELLPILRALRLPVVLELDHIPRLGRKAFVRLLSGCRVIVALTSQMRQAIIDMGVVSVPVIVEGDSVDLNDFEGLPPPADTRSSLGVGQSVPLFVYAGQLEAVGRLLRSRHLAIHPELLAALRILRKRGLEFCAVIAGGPERAKKKFAAMLNDDLKTHVQFLGRVEHLKIPTLLVAADVLLYPAPKLNHPFYTRDHSPLIMVEYMAAGRPIVAAELAPLHDIVNNKLVTFCPVGDAEALADAIRRTLDDPEGSAMKAKLARQQSEQFTWEKRMQRIVDAAKR